MTEADDGTPIGIQCEAWATLSALLGGLELGKPSDLGPSHEKHLTSSGLSRTCRDRGYW